MQYSLCSLRLAHIPITTHFLTAIKQEQLFDLPMDEILSVVSPADRVDTVQLSKMELF